MPSFRSFLSDSPLPDGVTEDQKLCLQNAIDFINLARSQLN
jgi:hypothetical protein